MPTGRSPDQALPAAWFGEVLHPQAFDSFREGVSDIDIGPYWLCEVLNILPITQTISLVYN